MEYKSGRLGLEERRQNVNYEELYGALAPLEKKLKDLAAGLQKSAKAIAKNTESGDLKSLAKELAACQEILKEEETIRNQIEELVEGFDAKEYFDSGDYAGQLMELCREQNVDITGSYPVFEMFPYRVRFEAENQDIYMNRKKVQCMRPLSLVRTVKDSQERLMKANFNAATFLNELAEAYDLALLKSKKPEGADLYLTHGHLQGPDNPPPLRPGECLVCGHTHLPVLRKLGRITYLNPGSLALPKEGTPHSYLTLEDGVFTWRDAETGAAFEPLH